ncbi:hypothetical protein LR002_00460 [Candidatus Gracilibacteria bacterium]|nr:hypothetical protein [Candidatus Gracilibacteria bacterium]
MTIQEIIEKEAKKLNSAYDLYKDGKSALKDLKKELQNALKNNPEWVELDEKSKLLKINRKEISEQIKEVDKAKDQISASFNEYTVVEDFKNSMDEKYTDQVDKSLNYISRELSLKGIDTEVEYKNGKLILIVSKH